MVPERNELQTEIDTPINFAARIQKRDTEADLILLFKSKLGQSNINHLSIFQQVSTNGYNTIDP